MSNNGQTGINTPTGKPGYCQKMKEIRSLESVCTHANPGNNQNWTIGFSADVKHDTAKYQTVVQGSSTMPVTGTTSAQTGRDTLPCSVLGDSTVTCVARWCCHSHYTSYMWTQESSCKTNTLPKIFHNVVTSQNAKLPFGCILLEV